MKDDVRILKSLFRASHAYGDKSAVGRFGFTGFSAELLIYHFKTINDVLDNFQAIPVTPIDFFNRSAAELKKIRRFDKDYFILTDPIDRNRNVAASISERSFKHVLRTVESLKMTKSLDLFIKKDIPTDIDISPELLEHFIIIEFESDGSRHYTELRDKLYKLANSITAQLEYEPSKEIRFGKTIFEVYFEDTIFILIFFIERSEISQDFVRRGPPVNNKDNFEKFISKNPNYFIKKDRAFVIEKREFTRPIQLITDYFQKQGLFSGIKLMYLNNMAKMDIHKKVVYIMKKFVLPIELN